MSALDVYWLPAELAATPPGNRVVVVVDVLRATTSISTALSQDAARVVPAPTVERARQIARGIEGALLCGERQGLPPEGFDLGNSPRAFVRKVVSGRPLVFTTTNGTAVMHALEGVEELVLACFRNGEAVARLLEPDLVDGGRGALIVCAGRRGRVSMDDAWCAGHLVGKLATRLEGLALRDGARAARALAARLGAPTAHGLGRTAGGRSLGEIELQDDLSVCAALDDLTVVPTWRDGAFVKGGEEDP